MSGWNYSSNSRKARWLFDFVGVVCTSVIESVKNNVDRMPFLSIILDTSSHSIKSLRFWELSQSLQMSESEPKHHESFSFDKSQFSASVSMAELN